MTTDSDADFFTWIERNPAPSLQSLAAKYGGYGNIPPEAWRDYDAAMERNGSHDLVHSPDFH
jgi:hypothetical protein